MTTKTATMNKSYFPASLYNAFMKIRSCRLVLKRAVDDDSIRHFEHYLNASIPISDRECGAREIVRAIFNVHGYKAFFRMISGNKMECCVLYLDARTIITYLKLIGLVYINESSDAGIDSFTVNAIVRPGIKDILKYKPICWADECDDDILKERALRIEAIEQLRIDIKVLDEFVDEKKSIECPIVGSD